MQSKEAINRLKGRINFFSNGALPTLEMSGKIYTWVSENNDGKLDGFTFYQYRAMLDKFTDEFNRSEMNKLQLKTSEIDDFVGKIIRGEIC